MRDPMSDAADALVEAIAKYKAAGLSRDQMAATLENIWAAVKPCAQEVVKDA